MSYRFIEVLNLIGKLSVSRSMSIEETEQLLINRDATPSLFVGNVRESSFARLQ